MKKLVLLIFLITSIVSRAQYMLYGTTGAGGTYNKGTIFSFNPITNQETVLFSFNGIDGNDPQSKLLYATDSLLYGETQAGGAHNCGVVFSFNRKTNMENVIINYDTVNGCYEHGGNELIQAKNGLLYGTSWAGGKYGVGVLYSYDIRTGKDSVLYNFDTLTSGIDPYRGLWEDTITKILYGVTETWGKFGGGVLHGFNTLTNKDSAYVNFVFNSIMPWEPSSGLLRASNGLLYGMSQTGGTTDSGTIYSYNIGTNVMNMVFQFHGVDGAGPNGNGLLQLSNGMMYGTTWAGGTQYGVLFSFNPTNNTETVLETFNSTNGAYPAASLTLNPGNGLLYGTTYEGGGSSEGVLFSYDIATSTYTKILDFVGINGSYPLGSLTLVDTLGSLGVNNISTKTSIEVYPNPSTGIFTIALSHLEAQVIEVYNMLGEKVYSNSYKPLANSRQLITINLSAQPNGIYLYRIISENGLASGEMIGEGKLIIQSR